MSEAEYERPAASAPLVQPEGVNAGSAAQIEEPARPKGRHRAESRPATTAPGTADQVAASQATAGQATAGQATAGSGTADQVAAGQSTATQASAAEPDELVGAPPNDPTSGQDAGSME